MEILELEKLSLSLNLFTDKEPEFNKSDYGYKENDDDYSARPKPLSRVISDEMDIDRLLDSNIQVQDRGISKYDVADEKNENIFKFDDEALEPPIIPVVI